MYITCTREKNGIEVYFQNSLVWKHCSFIVFPDYAVDDFRKVAIFLKFSDLSSFMLWTLESKTRNIWEILIVFYIKSIYVQSFL